MKEKEIKQVTVQKIIEEIDTNFTSIYKNCTKLHEQDDDESISELTRICKEIITNPTYLNFIILSNDISKIPPVKSLVQLMGYTGKLSIETDIPSQLSQYLGSLMGFIFKYVFGYEGQKNRVRVELFGIGTASRFTDCSYRIVIVG